ncbi:MAG: hypothetical protein S4CHLAM20_14090 [Chlamydiia bacterium]|nr:hypothetical protein [Chlamydiia bacterium]
MKKIFLALCLIGCVFGADRVKINLLPVARSLNIYIVPEDFVIESEFLITQALGGIKVITDNEPWPPKETLQVYKKKGKKTWKHTYPINVIGKCHDEIMNYDEFVEFISERRDLILKSYTSHNIKDIWYIYKKNIVHKDFDKLGESGDIQWLVDEFEKSPRMNNYIIPVYDANDEQKLVAFVFHGSNVSDTKDAIAYLK